MKKLLILIFLLGSLGANAQLSRFRAAKRQYAAMSYTEASKNLEAFLEQKKYGNYELEALRLLGNSYKKLNDLEKSEKIFEKIVNDFKSQSQAEDILNYAQALASNGKYRESQKMYSLYGQEQKEDLRGRKFTVAYMDRSAFYKDSANYEVNYMYPINSRQSDFSPMYYEDGIVFVSARDEGGVIKRIFSQNETPFLDLFLFPDTAKLNSKNKELLATAGLSGSGKNEVADENSTIGLVSGSQEDIEEFSKKVNSKYHEGPVTFFKDYERLIFTRNNYNGRRSKGQDGITKLKLYYASKEKGKWKNIKELPFNSNEFSCGHPALNTTDDVLYFASDKPGGYGGTDIYKVTYKNNIWGKPENLGPNVNTEGNELFPYVDEAGNLFFASNGLAGLGGLDIFYIALKNDEPIGIADNLGAPINSEKDDFGIISNPDRTLGYFSSNRKKGLDDDNIYSFVKTCRQLNIIVLDKKTNEPINAADLRIIKNGSNKDLKFTNDQGLVSLCLDKGNSYELIAFKDGYLNSSLTYATNAATKNAKSELVLYLEQSRRPSIEGKIIAQQSGLLLNNARVILRNIATGEEISMITAQDGTYQFQPAENGKYELIVEADGYARNVINLGKVRQSWKANTVYEQNVGMLKKGDIIRIENIYYDFDKYAIRRDARKSLNEQLLVVMEKYPSMTIELRSHTDSRGPKAYNKKLSERRAQAVVNYLISKGINKSRLTAIGLGEEELVNNCADGVKCSASQHQENRRTEFKIISIN